MSAPATPAPTARYRAYVLFLLTVVYTFNFLDRQILGILAPAIQKDLGVSDTGIGLLGGIYFAFLYTVVGIPVARLADRHNRVTIIAISLALWSGFTALCGMATNFTQLALARVGVGIGEAGGTPPAHSLISDYFPKEKRAGALAIYSMGIPIGVTLAYLGGGWVSQNYSWQVTFLTLGIPGIFVALLLRLTVRERPRGSLDQLTVSATPKHEPLFDVRALWNAATHLLRIPTYRGMLTGQTAASMSSYAFSAFIVIFFFRSHPEFAKPAVYFWLGIINGTAYVAGVFAGGWLVDRFAVKSKSAYGYVPAIALFIHVPLTILALWAGSPVWSLIFWWPVHFLIGIHLGPGFALAQTLAPVRMRALSTAIYFLILNIIALGMGPSLTGFLSDLLANQAGLGAEQGLRVAMTLLVIPVLIAAIAFLRVAKKVDADWARANPPTA